MIKLKLLLLSPVLFASVSPVFSQKPVAPEIQLLTRSTTRRETRRFTYGGTVTLIAAPRGSVTVEGWSRNEVELTADIELKGPTEAELDQLAKVNNFVFDEDLNHLSVLTTGTHDRDFMKTIGKELSQEAAEPAVEDRLPFACAGEHGSRNQCRSWCSEAFGCRRRDAYQCDRK